MVHNQSIVFFSFLPAKKYSDWCISPEPRKEFPGRHELSGFCGPNLYLAKRAGMALNGTGTTWHDIKRHGTTQHDDLLCRSISGHRAQLSTQARPYGSLVVPCRAGHRAHAGPSPWPALNCRPPLVEQRRRVHALCCPLPSATKSTAKSHGEREDWELRFCGQEQPSRKNESRRREEKSCGWEGEGK